MPTGIPSFLVQFPDGLGYWYEKLGHSGVAEIAETNSSITPQKRPSTSGNVGTNQVDVRSYNERLILQLLRWNESLTKSEIGRATNLSPNAISVIIRALDDAGLIDKDAPIRGRIGQPSTPVKLNPDARYYLGLKIGRRTADLVCINFLGEVLATRSISYSHPVPDEVREFLRKAIKDILKCARLRRAQVDGFGIAMPTEIWSWSKEIGVEPGLLEVWRDTDVAKLLPRGSPWVPSVVNDATAACIAEATFRQTGALQDAIYLFVGTLIGGGVILNGSVFFGRGGTAGGFGPFRVPGGKPGADRLIDQASLILLERALSQSKGENAPLASDAAWSDAPKIVEAWLHQAARGIAHTIVSSLSVIDFQAVIIDGSFPEDIRARLVDKVRVYFGQMDLQGINNPEISEGHYGSIARAVGAAALPLSKAFSLDQNTLLRTR